MPEPTERRSETKQIAWLRTRPFQCGMKVVVIGFKRRKHFRFVLDPMAVGAFGDFKKMSKMSLPCLVLFAYFDEPFRTVLPQCFEQAITQLFVGKLLHRDERFVDQLFDMIQRIAIWPDRLHCWQIEPARKNTQSSEKRAFFFRKQIVAPVDRRSQSLVPAAPAG